MQSICRDSYAWCYGGHLRSVCYECRKVLQAFIIMDGSKCYTCLWVLVHALVQVTIARNWSPSGAARPSSPLPPMPGSSMRSAREDLLGELGMSPQSGEVLSQEAAEIGFGTDFNVRSSWEWAPCACGEVYYRDTRTAWLKMYYVSRKLSVISVSLLHCRPF